MAEIENTGNDTNVWKSWYVDDADQYANWSQDLITASRALHNQRKQLHKVMNQCEDIFERFTGNYEQTDRAKLAVENELMKLTRCTTYWCYMLLARKDIINWDAPYVSRFGIKPSMKYTDKRFLMNIDTIIDGHTYNWKADFHGHENFPKRLDDADDVQELLVGIKDRIHSYHEKIQSKMNKRQHQPRYQQQPHSNFHEQNLQDTLHLLKSLMEDLVEKMENDPDQLEKQERNSLHAQLGRRFHGDQDLAKVHEQDGDVTYNTKKQVYYRFVSNFQLESDYETNGISNLDYTVEVFKHFPYRRNRGVHIDTENKKTIKWFNNVLPYVSRGWYEVVVTIENQAYKIQLAPWERKNTTFVRPFALVSKESPVHSQNKLIDLNHQGFDFRDKNLQDFEITRLTPYLIHGKGNDIDAMVHSLRVIDSLERNIQEKIDTDVTWLADKIKEMPVIYGPLIQDQSLMQYMRAYFSSDAKTGVIGDRSVFFFNIQGVIVGVEMYAPSLPPYVDLQGRSGGYGKLPRNPRKHHKEDSSMAPEPSNAPHWYPPAPKAEVHVTGIPPEIMTFIEKASHKISDIEKYMKEHKAELPAQIERIVREATKDIKAAKSAMDYSNESAMQQDRQVAPLPSAWAVPKKWNAFEKKESEVRPTNVYAHKKEEKKESEMTHEELELKKEKDLEKAEKKRQYEAEVEALKIKMEELKYRWNEQLPPILGKEKARTIGEEEWDYSTFPSEIKGRYNHMYQLQLYPLLRQGVPYVDVAGLVPAEVYLNVEIPNTDGSHTEYYGILKCINSEIPAFEGQLALPAKKINNSIEQEMADVVITRYVIKNSNNIPQFLVWGIKSKLASEKKYKFIGYKPLTVVKSNSFLIGAAIAQRWKFTHDFEQNEIAESMGSRAIVRVRNTSVEDQYQRVPNSINEHLTEMDSSEKDDFYQVLNVEELEHQNLYGLSAANLAEAKRRQEFLITNLRTNKIILHVFSQKHREKLYADRTFGEALKKSINVFSTPMYLRMSSYYLNEDPKLDPSKIDPQDEEMCLVDIQGPIYISKNGKFMVSPTLYESERNTKAITWGIYIWNSNRAEYQLLAVKLSGKHSTHLVNDPEQTKDVKDWELGAEAENYWKQFINFDGVPQVEKELNKVQLINFYLPNPDTKLENNPYHMHFRYPDYTISTAEFNVNNYRARARGQGDAGEIESELVADNIGFELDEAFHETNTQFLEQFTQQQFKMLGPKVVIPGFFTHKSNHSTAHANKPVNRKRQFYNVKNDWFVYRTFKAENSLLGHNPWEFAMTKVLIFLKKFFDERLAENEDNDEIDQMIQQEERRLKNQTSSVKRKDMVEYTPVKYNPDKQQYRPRGGQQQYSQYKSQQKSRFKEEFHDDTEDYLLRQCFDDQPAAQRLPAQPRKLAAPVRTFAPWKPPAAGVSW